MIIRSTVPVYNIHAINYCANAKDVHCVHFVQLTTSTISSTPTTQLAYCGPHMNISNNFLICAVRHISGSYRTGMGTLFLLVRGLTTFFLSQFITENLFKTKKCTVTYLNVT